MSFEIPVDLERDLVRYAEETHVTPDEAAERLLRDALRHQRTPAQRLIGLFSSPEDVALMEEVDRLIAEGRQADAEREIDW